MYKLWRDISLQSRARYKGSGGKEARKVEKKQKIRAKTKKLSTR